MTPFKRAHYTQAETVRMADELLAQPASFFEPFLGPNPTSEAIIALVDRQVQERCEEEVYVNDLYQVAVRPADPWEGEDWPEMIHLSIRRRDRTPIHDWRHLQEIKNELVGPEHEALELYPAESRRVDSANQFHLFVLKDKGIRFPFGFPGRYVTDKADFGKAVQRSL